LRSIACVFLAALWSILGAGCMGPSKAKPPAEVPLPPEIAESIPPSKAFDHRPYEFIWSGRKAEGGEPLIDFEQLNGWTVDVEGDADARVERTQELQLWGRYVGKFTYRDPTGDSRIVLRPPEPLPIRDRFNSVSCWIHGHPGLDAAAASRRPVEVAVLVRHADGSHMRIPLAPIDWNGWWLAHRVLSEAVLEEVRFPCLLTGIEFRHCRAETETAIYLDSLRFYSERLPPLQFESRPARNLTLFPGQSAGVHTGERRLPFPTREDTIVPTLSSGDYTNRVYEDDRGVFHFVYQGAEEKLEYTFEPLNGLSGIEARWNGHPVARVLDGAGVRGFERPEGTITVRRMDGHTVWVQYRSGVSYALRMRGRSLLVDVLARGGEATGFRLGRLSGVRQPRAVPVPGLTMGRGPHPAVAVLESGSAGEPASMFASVFLDWYRSNASELYALQVVDTDAITVNGGARYKHTTAGRRNDLFERVVVTVAPRIEEVLPTIPNPVGRRSDMAAKRLWVNTSGPVDLKAEHETCVQLRQLGATHIVQCTGSEVWQDEYESYSLRTRAAPHRGGDAVLKWYVDAQQSLGWRSGLYANYYDLSPLSQHWSKDAVQRTASGNWKRAAAGNYAMKAVRALEWQERLSPIVKSRFGPDAVFVDRVTSQPPWASTDYDERVPGAGTFTQPFYCYGELLLNESDVYEGPVIGAGGAQWLYAGLLDASLGSAAHPAIGTGQPYLPLFYLLQIHPRSATYGLGRLPEYFDGETEWQAEPDRAVDEYLAAQLAYGTAGRLVPPKVGLRRLCRSYYMMEQVQQRYALRRPEAVEYWDGQRMFDTSEAVKSGAYTRSQLRVRYPGNLRLWVNGSPDRAWEVGVGGEEWKLPPFGWLAAGSDFFECSVEHEGRRVDYVQSPEYVYYDGRDEETPFLNLACASSLLLRRGSGGRELEVLNINRAPRFAWNDPHGEAVPVQCTAFTAEGTEIGEVGIVEEGGRYWFAGPTNALRYVIRLNKAIDVVAAGPPFPSRVATP